MSVQHMKNLVNRWKVDVSLSPLHVELRLFQTAMWLLNVPLWCKINPCFPTVLKFSQWPSGWGAGEGGSSSSESNSTFSSLTHWPLRSCSHPWLRNRKKDEMQGNSRGRHSWINRTDSEVEKAKLKPVPTKIKERSVPFQFEVVLQLSPPLGG